MHRFFVSPNCFERQTVVFPGNVSHQMARVLRFQPGDRIVVIDDSGFEYLVSLTHVNSRRTSGIIIEKQPNQNEPNIKVDLYQGILKTTKLEFVLQKGTEIGVDTFTPISCVRSIPKTSLTNRTVRWRKIITEAAEQSRRGKIPALEKITTFYNACNAHKGLGIIPWEHEPSVGLKSLLRRWENDRREIETISIFIGPEGGFTEEEIGYAKSKGIVSVSLGRRILKAETAGITAISLILYELGDLGM